MLPGNEDAEIDENSISNGHEHQAPGSFSVARDIDSIRGRIALRWTLISLGEDKVTEWVVDIRGGLVVKVRAASATEAILSALCMEAVPGTILSIDRDILCLRQLVRQISPTAAQREALKVAEATTDHRPYYGGEDTCRQ